MATADPGEVCLCVTVCLQSQEKGEGRRIERCSSVAIGKYKMWFRAVSKQGMNQSGRKCFKGGQPRHMRAFSPELMRGGHGYVQGWYAKGSKKYLCIQ